ncbi:hypothetical protein ACLBOM_12675 [Escherichia coli]
MREETRREVAVIKDGVECGRQLRVVSVGTYNLKQLNRMQVYDQEMMIGRTSNRLRKRSDCDEMSGNLSPHPR